LPKTGIRVTQDSFPTRQAVRRNEIEFSLLLLKCNGLREEFDRFSIRAAVLRLLAGLLQVVEGSHNLSRIGMCIIECSTPVICQCRVMRCKVIAKRALVPFGNRAMQCAALGE